MTPDPYAASSAPVLHLDGFEGPLDFLLELARAQKVDLARLSIVEVVDQYLAAIEAPGAAATLAVRSDWLVAASWLVLLRSKLLLPQAEDEPVPETERLLEGLRRAEARDHARRLAGWLERQPQLGREVFGRGGTEAAAPEEGRGAGDLLDLLLACFDLLQVSGYGRHTVAPAAVYKRHDLDVWQLAEVLVRVRGHLTACPHGGELWDFVPECASRLSSPLRRRSGIAGTFVAALELTREGVATLEQADSFASIVVRQAPSARRKQAARMRCASFGSATA